MASTVDVGMVSAMLDQALFSHNVEHQQHAMRAIQEYEQCEGYVASLVQIVQNVAHYNKDARLLAIISLKNMVGRCWTSRGSAARLISQEEKRCLRQFTLNYFVEPNKKISIQLAALTAKMGRYDWPAQWPDLLPTLFRMVQSQDSWLVQKRAMYTMHEVLQELSEKALPQARRAFLEASIEMFPVMAPLWLEMCKTIAERVNRLSQAYMNMTASERGALQTGIPTRVSVICHSLIEVQ
jgi:hypothetical protein